MSVIDDLLKHLDAPQRSALEHVRKLVHQTVPGAEEVMTYGMPGFKYRGRYLIAFAAFKDHLSVFPGGAPIEALRPKLGAFKLSKGTVQFTLDHPIPDDLLQQIIKLSQAAVDSRYKK